MEKITTPNWDLNSWISSKEYIDYTAQSLSENLKINTASRILDIGCGRGNIANALAKLNRLNYPIDAVDISDSILEAESTNTVRFYHSDVKTFLDNKRNYLYDGIIMKQMFHLIPYDVRQPLLYKLKKCLKKEGRIVVLLMSPTLTIPMFQSGKDTFHQEIFPLGELLDLAVMCGFKTLVTPFSFKVTMSKFDYFELLKQRFMSNLRNLSDAEIKQGIIELDDLLPNDQLEFFDQLDVVHLIH